ncbi:MAG: sigma-54-dependent Fis family transcriptional regulator [Nitrospira sp. SG-bin2]|uniref:PEP-CTERM-box response regulator transcription factor n=1 Tax=Nitrospira cf. moscoviensis SBR1015 TaxID=96242 RepID=UPI000A0D67CA|nr:PEP-CTERM-box response regulator transcription factor [Nitrospira cf. moscoviensis SBR1015]OQW32181.1 MAG: sigma-54-dependent Fis family transcriptional regulator [Nitrospira sp. SG-bin2]
MTANPVLLLVDDDEQIREQMKWALAGTYQVLEASDRPTAIEQMRRVMPELILLDLGLPPDIDGASEGLAILREALKLNPLAKVIVITGNSDRAKAVAAIQGGAYDFIEKPIQLDVLKVVLQRAQYLANLERENRAPLQQAGQSEFEGLVGNSEPMQEVFRMIRRVGPSDVPVLITGESGTGKELVARAIHCQSRRKDAAFVAINCGAIPDTLIESELFGYEKGAFTGAAQQRKGRIEGAQGGTLFLDEVGDIPLPLQVKLLRFLQEHEIQRLGGKETITLDTRVIAATNVDLRQAVSEGRFREDLYYRLCVISIPVPPLSTRRADIPLLARTFLLRFADHQRKPITGFSSEAMAALTGYSWPGNVRELENRVKRAVVMAEGKYITPENLELTAAIGHEGDERTIRGSRESREKELVLLAMEKAQGNVSRAAAELGISRPTLYQLLARYGLKKPKLDR